MIKIIQKTSELKKIKETDKEADKASAKLKEMSKEIKEIDQKNI